MILESAMKNKTICISSIVLLICTISTIAYNGNSANIAQAQLNSNPMGEIIALENQQPLEDQQPLENQQPLEDQQPLENQQPLEDQQPLENQQPLTGLNEKVSGNPLHSTVQAPKETQKAMPFILPFDSGLIMDRQCMQLRGSKWPIR